jgi:hypothetical protein
MTDKQRQEDEQNLDAGEFTGDEPKTRKTKASAPKPMKEKAMKTGKKIKTTKQGKKAKPSKKKNGKTPGPKKGFRVKDKSKYPNSRYLFDELYHKNRKLTFNQFNVESKKWFPDKSLISEKWFENRVALHKKQGYVSKRWLNRDKKGKKVSGARKKK